ncbi:DNA polymerase I [Anaerovorax odorimutans]|uniref:DNA polymerase I n=1 Tax=Anaerovorax odorimutans TaxID=109327 RepID=A0ABT1RL71_9FIRM|nr:DNA polymerase I [Anaerovorax odorimutans]MCQ4635929.1 DNA polymerase I [Anaerovorax odorimutans]
MEKTIVIIDGNSLINRAYYAMQRPMITKDGIYTQGIYGFLNMLTKIEKDYEPGYITVAFDLKAPTFRHKEYKEYKAGRKKMPPELVMQMPLLKDVLRAMNIKLLEMEGFEADDIIGTVAREAEEQGLEPLIITGDKDELQLATDKTKVIITKRGISQFEIYDRQAMIDKYGFTPTQFIDFKGLMGDQSDNIPGLPGVGEKTAQKLILEYGSVEELIANTDKITSPKLKEKIEGNVQLAVMSKRLATINTNVPIEIDFSEFLMEEPDYDQLIQIYTKLEFNSFLKKLDKNAVKNAAQQTIIDTEDVEKTVIREPQQIADINLTEKIAVKVLGDYNHVARPKIYGIGIMSTDRQYYYINCEKEETLTAVMALFNEKEPCFIGHDLKNDYYMLMNYGLTSCCSGFDTAIGQYVLESGRSNYNLKTLAYEYFHESLEDEKEFFENNSQVDLFSDPTEVYSTYGLQWCATVLSLMPVLEQKIESEDLQKVLYEVELPLIEVMAAMERDGFTVDRKELTDLGEVITAQVETITQKIYDLAGESFNINSPAQLGPILFDKLGLTAGKKTKRGYSTSAETLEKIIDEHEIVPLILEYRTLTKLNSTYIEGLLPLIDENNKIHAHFNQTVTATGRISCTEPNLQNIPIRQAFGRQLRKAFVPEDENHTLVGADYSQIELRVLAHMADDPALIDAFNQGEDIHRTTAANVLGVPKEQITIEERSRAKAVNFGVIYGMSAFGLSSELHITRKDADAYIKAYFEKHAAVKVFMDQQVQFCKEQGYVSTIMGRKRYINEIGASNYMVRQVGERLAMNSPIQGSAADIIKLAMIKVYRQLKEQGLKSRLILQVHDELIIETCKEEQDIIERLLAENMENAIKLKAKLVVDLNQGDSWYDLK